MSDTDLCYTSATDLAALIRDKKLSPVELMEAVLARIEAHEPAINAFATLTADAAMEAARKAEADVANGVALGPLHGIPVTIKDLVVTEGIATERGSFSQKGVVPEVDAPCVTRLKQAGSIVLGKTTTSEFGWKGVSQSPLTGITSNPWKIGYNAGASSAGAGAGAAAGFGPLHQGSDGAGSIRMPSHFSGIFGLKPTYGRVPNWPVPNNDQTTHIGPMTRTVADSALMLEVMSGPHPWDHTALESAPEPYLLRLDSGVTNLRVTYSPDLGHARVDDEVAELVTAAVNVFANDLGCRVEEVEPTFGPDGPEIIRFLWSAHEQAFAPFLDAHKNRMDPGLIGCITSGMGHSMEDYLDMRQRKLSYVEEVHRAFEQCDLMLTPSVSVAAFPADRLQPEHWPQHPWDWINWAEFSYPFNFSGNPAASVPCGFTKDGLPVGLQIVGRRFADLTVLQAAAAFENTCPWADKRPPL